MVCSSKIGVVYYFLDPKNDLHDENPKENVKIANLINADVETTKKSKKNNAKGILINNML